MREGRPSTQDLLELAEREGHPVKAATLASWRRRGLLPHPRRAPGARSRYLYPQGTDHQLRRLLYWRARSERLYLIAVALWVEGFPIRQGVIRGALVEFTVDWGRSVEQILSAETEVSSEVLARTLARQRSRAPIPRLSRMRQADRERAYGYLMAVMLGLEEEAASRSQDLPHVQRLFGFRRGHDGGLADQFPLDDLEGLGRELLPSSAKPVLARASGAELELVRRVVAMVVNLLPRLGPEMLADEPVKALDLVTLIREFCAEPPAEVLAFLVVVWLSSLQAKNPNEAELRTHIEALSPAAVEAEISVLLPPDVSA
jgi:DNA-binding transcriptional MerR regulator